ncbi:hypothetical protein YC2023_038175 [Brassica napus]
MGSESDSVEEKAAARKEALRALRAAQELSESKEEGEGDAAVEEESLTRNGVHNISITKQFCRLRLHSCVYIALVKLCSPPELPKFEDPVAALPPAVEKKEDPFVNIAPKKQNWDLRRDVQKKLDKLESWTQKAMYKLMEEHEKERETEKLMKRQQKVERPDDTKEAAEHSTRFCYI